MTTLNPNNAADVAAVTAELNELAQARIAAYARIDDINHRRVEGSLVEAHRALHVARNDLRAAIKRYAAVGFDFANNYLAW